MTRRVKSARVQAILALHRMCVIRNILSMGMNHGECFGRNQTSSPAAARRARRIGFLCGCALSSRRTHLPLATMSGIKKSSTHHSKSQPVMVTG